MKFQNHLLSGLFIGCNTYLRGTRMQRRVILQGGSEGILLILCWMLMKGKVGDIDIIYLKIDFYLGHTLKHFLRTPLCIYLQPKKKIIKKYCGK